MAPWVARLAEAEGLPHHGRSAKLRGPGPSESLQGGKQP
jgi:histidinol dehydrogenase